MEDVSPVAGYRIELFMGHKWGQRFNVTLTGLEPECSSHLAIGLAEIFSENCYKGKRIMSVGVSGKTVISNMDVFSIAGCRRGLTRKRRVTADARGDFVLSFSAAVDKSMFSFVQLGNTRPTAKPRTNTPVKPTPKSPSRSPTTVLLAPLSPSVTFVPGELTVQENGLLLSTGLASKLIGTKGTLVSYHNGGQSATPFHLDPDAGAVFPDTDANNPGGWIYVNNAEVHPKYGVPEGQGGVGAFTFNKDGHLIDDR